MPELEESALPGVGVRFELTTRSGKRIGIVSHRSGRREISVQDAEDPDTFRPVLALTQEEAQTFSEMLRDCPDKAVRGSVTRAKLEAVTKSSPTDDGTVAWAPQDVGHADP